MDRWWRFRERYKYCQMILRQDLLLDFRPSHLRWFYSFFDWFGDVEEDSSDSDAPPSPIISTRRDAPPSPPPPPSPQNNSTADFEGNDTGTTSAAPTEFRPPYASSNFSGASNVNDESNGTDENIFFGVRWADFDDTDKEEDSSSGDSDSSDSDGNNNEAE